MCGGSSGGRASLCQCLSEGFCVLVTSQVVLMHSGEQAVEFPVLACTETQLRWWIECALRIECLGDSEDRLCLPQEVLAPVQSWARPAGLGAPQSQLPCAERAPRPLRRLCLCHSLAALAGV